MVYFAVVFFGDVTILLATFSFFGDIFYGLFLDNY
jgi:hypothetical protein